jgi:hypothetical protein
MEKLSNKCCRRACSISPSKYSCPSPSRKLRWTKSSYDSYSFDEESVGKLVKSVSHIDPAVTCAYLVVSAFVPRLLPEGPIT